jgi:LmbE family N-acetylglucosaminyl deacetylase
MQTYRLQMCRTVVIVVAHSDDEALGCGGAIARHVAQGDSVAVISMTDGVGSRESSTKTASQRRRSAAHESARELGFTWLAEGDFPDNEMDTVPLLEVARFLEQSMGEVTPSLLYTHHAGDLNADHRVVFQALLTACRPQSSAVECEIRAFEVASSTEWNHHTAGAPFTPDLFIGIERFWPRKEAALRAYADEMRAPPHARSVEGLWHLAALRGHQAGLPLAEAFMTIRHIVP